MVKTAIITGACGFLGSHLANKFLDEDYIVVGIDDFCTSLGRDAPHVVALQKRKNFFLQEFDICDQTKWASLYSYIDDLHDQLGYKGRLCDIVLNFACPASPPRYMKIPVKTLLTSVVGGHNALEFARKSHSIFVQASTSEVYGDALVSPQPETYWGNVNSFGFRSNYDEGKRALEALIFDYIQQYNLDARIVRIFNTYGPHMDKFDGRVITNLIRQAINNEDVTIFGDGLQTRSFCFIDDLIEQIWRVSNLQNGVLTTPINIGNDCEYSILEVCNILFKDILKKDFKIINQKLPSDDPKIRKPDLLKAKTLLNFSANISLLDGLQRTFLWMKQNQ
jgi:nucleoside-diphosphate-sugar epimerase